MRLRPLRRPPRRRRAAGEPPDRYRQTVDEVAEALAIDPAKGLSDDEARARREWDGANEPCDREPYAVEIEDGGRIAARAAIAFVHQMREH